MEVLRTGTVDGVPLLSAAGDGPARVSLQFRVGTADEALSRSGLSHLVEHLALGTLGQPRYRFNGSTGETVTDFWAEGSAEECAAFLHDVASALAALPLDRLPAELRVLRAEDGGGRSSTAGRLLEQRCGLGTYGAMRLDELGLRVVTGDDVVAWAAARFTAAGAVVTWCGPPVPDDLSCPLPAGPPPPQPPALAPWPGLPLPLAVADDLDALALGLVARRGPAATAVDHAASRRLHQVLRLDRGLVYGVHALGRDMTAAQAHLGWEVDGTAEHAVAARAGLLEVLDALAEHGPTEQELDDVVDLLRREAAAPGGREELLAAQAARVLLGLPPEDLPEQERQLRAVRPAQAAAALADALGTAVLLYPEELPPPPSGRWWSLDDVPGPEPVTGTVCEARGLRRSRRDTLVVGADGLTHRSAPTGQLTTVRWPDLVLVVRGHDGTAEVFSRRDAWVRVRPADFRDPAQVRALLDRHLDPALVVPAHDVAGHAQVQAVAQAQLPRRGSVGEELEWLGSVLRDGEVLLLLGRGMQGLRLGLLAVTDRRTLFLYRVGDEADVREHPHSRVRGAGTQRRLTAVDLVLEAAEGPVRYLDVDPKGRAEEMARRVALAASGG